MSPEKEGIVPASLVEKAKNCVEFISSRTPIEKTDVTSHFATNLVELSEGALQRISNTSDQNYNMRFIKPSKKFYNLLMSVWMGFDAHTLKSLDFQIYLDSVKDRIGLMKWKD